MEKTANEILETIYNFDSIVRNIQQIKLEAKKANLTSQSLLGGDIELYSYVKICNAHHEIELMHKYAPNNQMLFDILYALKPLLKIINEYKTGIKRMRNGILAHFNRDSKGNFVPYWQLFTRAKLPQEPGELDLIYSCLDIFRVVLVDHFEKDLIPFYTSIDEELTLRFAEWKNSLGPIPTKDLIGVKEEINKRLAEKGLIGQNEDYIGRLKVQKKT
jgi:hypothetical protein